MADAAGTEPTTEPVVKKRSPVVPIIVAVSAIAGVLAATLFAAPRIIASRAPTVEDQTEGSGEHGTSRASGGHGAAGGEGGEFVELGNILVNPAGSQGLRFVMASVTFEVFDQKKLDDMRRRDAQLRDIVIATLERYTMERLTSPGARDAVKRELAQVVDSIFGTNVDVYMPQFVIN
jgi:flagellar basal body-associated protein FliL